MGGYSTPQALDSTRHSFDDFTCASDLQTRWARELAVKQTATNMVTTYVTTEHDSGDVVAFYSLCAGSIERERVSAKLRRNSGGHPIPVFLLARLATHADHEGNGLGGAMLLDAMTRSLALATGGVGARALVLHCENDVAREFYLHVEPAFQTLPGDELDLLIPMDSIRRSLT